MRRVAGVGLLVLALTTLIAGCDNPQSTSSTATTAPASRDTKTSTPTPSRSGRVEESATAATTTTAAPGPARRPPFPPVDDDCPESPVPGGRSTITPPFTPTYLPERISAEPVEYRAWVDANRPPGHDAAYEPYDPHYLYLDPDKPVRAVAIYHANSWRLGSVLREELVVMGRMAWLSDLPNGAVLIDFQADDAGTICGRWAISNNGIDEAELRRVAASLK